MRPIDAETLQKRFNDYCATECAICHYYKEEKDINSKIDFRCGLVDEAPTIETFTREELENWLYTICYNNIDGNEEDMKFAKHTEEIIRRLDGFERYVKDKREGKI